MREIRWLPAAVRLAALLVPVSLAKPAPAGEIVCEGRYVPVRLRHNLYVLEHETHCYAPADDLVEALRARCDLLLDAYGETEGRERCRRMLEASALLESGS
jgi:hypothetical protein